MNSPSPSSGFSIRRGCTAAAVGLRVIHQHMTDRFRRVEDHGGAPEDAADDHLVLVGSLRPNPQIVGAHQRQELTRREVLRSGIRMRRDEGPNVLGRDGCLHRPCFTTFSLHGREAGGASWKEGTIHTTARTKPSPHRIRRLLGIGQSTIRKDWVPRNDVRSRRLLPRSQRQSVSGLAANPEPQGSSE
jgi:hypothetical protein